MGEMADYYAELAWQYSEEEDYIGLMDSLIEKKIWLTKDRREIKIKKMETSHIQNCITLIRKKNWRQDYLELFIKELKKRKNGSN